MRVCFVLFLALRTLWLTRATTCSSSYSCALQSLMSNDSSNIQCYGYRSCEKALTIESTSSGYIECDGSYSCFNASIITHAGPGQTECSGLFSCAHVGQIQASQWAIICNGEKSCVESKIITASGSSGILQCYGDQSCINSQIQVRRALWAYGNLAAKNSVFYGNGSFVSLSFYGPDSGYNVSLHCGDSSACYIHCRANACNNFGSLTQGSSSAIGRICNNAEKSDFCPNGLFMQKLVDVLSVSLFVC